MEGRVILEPEQSYISGQVVKIATIINEECIVLQNTSDALYSLIGTKNKVLLIIMLVQRPNPLDLTKRKFVLGIVILF